MNRSTADLVSGFLAWAQGALAANTVAAYRHQLRKFVALHGAVKVRQIRSVHVTSWARTWHEVQAVVRLFNWARDEAGIVRCSPFIKLRLPRRGRRKRILLPADIVRLLRSARGYARNYLIALRETFARPQEIRLACWEDLQSEDMRLSMEEALPAGKAILVFHDFKDCGRRKDSTRPRVLLVTARLGRLMVRLRRRSVPSTGPIFPNSKGEPLTKNCVRCLMRRLRVRVGLGADQHGEKIVAYTLRHSLATFAASQGIGNQTLADLLGHVDARTTSRYLHLQVSHLREAIARLRRRG